MLRLSCAAYSGFPVRHAPVFADDGGFAKISYSQTEDSVEEAAQRFAEAFYNCSYNYSDTLGVIIGTSNYGGYVSSQHGIEWANMVNRVNTWLIYQERLSL
jgi:hypothetical protein